MIDVASGAGRVMAQSDSTLYGKVRIRDAASGEALVTTLIVAKDEAMKAGGNIGGLISLAVNIADAGKSDRSDDLAEVFAANTAEWLLR